MPNQKRSCWNCVNGFTDYNRDCVSIRKCERGLNHDNNRPHLPRDIGGKCKKFETLDKKD